MQTAILNQVFTDTGYLLLPLYNGLRLTDVRKS